MDARRENVDVPVTVRSERVAYESKERSRGHTTLNVLMFKFYLCTWTDIAHLCSQVMRAPMHR